VALFTCWTCIRLPLFNKRTLLVALFTFWTCIRLPLFNKRTCLVCSLLGAILVGCGHCVWRAACCGVSCFARGSRGCCVGGTRGAHPGCFRAVMDTCAASLTAALLHTLVVLAWPLGAGVHWMGASGLCCSSCILLFAGPGAISLGSELSGASGCARAHALVRAPARPHSLLCSLHDAGGHARDCAAPLPPHRGGREGRHHAGDAARQVRARCVCVRVCVCARAQVSVCVRALHVCAQ